ncbi:SpoIIE family protein phosphatase [Conexibacter sp. CPCC 206217]|uniref:ATP-binding SpoIIE family protein phosphatase n=1 Tax=Conexibacter sp. CPCC 206217 TaxID=3064574 RepID=UPI00271FF2B5|nr:SpoIIE family protein phosphatase [Conexibacter sp. CPCC 206217]MDO8212164.1 SpoIIE family protein phosphatase [Conexibacter sp. CPCC 206217]
MPEPIEDDLAAALTRGRLRAQPVELHGLPDDAHARLEKLHRIADAALAYLPQEELLVELLERVSEILDSDTAAILLLDRDDGLLRARAAKGIEEEVEQGVTIPLGKGFAGRIAAERRPIVIDDVDHADILNPILREKGIRSLLGVPLLVEGNVLGVLHVGSLRPRRFTADETDLLQLAADRAALAIEHAALYEQRRLAEALQRQLLPDLRTVPGTELASRYLPASRETLGGDWYDAFPLPGGRVAVAVGDVVGHGVAAAAVMAQLRTALRAYAADGYGPASVVERMNRLMWQLGPHEMTTLSYLVLDPEAATFEHVSAGHPPPLVIDVEHGADFLDVVPNLPLAVGAGSRFHSTVHPYRLGTTFLLYTDGLVERRGELIDEGLARLRAAAGRECAVEPLCRQVETALVAEQRSDDVAMIAIRIPPPTAVLSGRWPADRRMLAEIRMQLRAWLRAHGAGEDESYDITVACQEACANAIEHAYSPGSHSFELTATCDDGLVEVCVRDDGSWRPPRGEHRGRGTLLMRRLTDTLEIEHGDDGTVVTLTRRLRGGRA